MSNLKKNSSPCWKYFNKNVNEPNMAICKICKNSYKRGNNTSNLLDHLKRKHFTVLTRDSMLSLNDESDNDISVPGNYLSFYFIKYIFLKEPLNDFSILFRNISAAIIAN